jgi:tRNA (guanosine-2'-O-)-methyltransferase
MMNECRKEKIEKVAIHRQLDLTVILENIQDPHNLGAVLRSCDAVGIREIYTVYSDGDYIYKPIPLGKKSTMGTRKWVDVHHFTDLEQCMELVKSRYSRILGTIKKEASSSVFDLDLCQPTALMFGNEKHGLTEPAIALCDGFFYIPQVGMVESLNLSVACAVSLYESFRQRQHAGYYQVNENELSSGIRQLKEEYIERGKSRESARKTEME